MPEEIQFMHLFSAYDCLLQTLEGRVGHICAHSFPCFDCCCLICLIHGSIWTPTNALADR